MNNFICPNCGESYYVINNSYSTAMYCPPIYKDGQLVSIDGNYHIHSCTCLACHHNFTARLYHNDIEYMDNGEAEVFVC